MEYNRAIERNIPRLIFLMDERHPVTVQGIDRGPVAEKLDKLRARLKKERTVSFFNSPDDLLAKVIDSLSNLKRDVAIITTPVETPIPSYDPRNPVFFVPFKSKGDQVIGRQAALNAVRTQLEHGHRTAIGQTASFMGLGGLGKTQLAIEYAYTFRDQYPNGVIWINVDQDIDRQLYGIGERARWFPPESEPKDKIAIARQRLRTYSHVLVVFDNLQDAKAIAEYLPDPEGEPHILVTSRSEHGGFVPIPLDPLDAQLSLDLLVQESGRNPTSESERQAAKEIAEKLGGLPLALELAGAYLRHRPTTWEHYRDLLTNNLKAALPAKFLQGSFTRHEADLYSTLRVNAESFSEEPLLKDILDILTWSGPGPMGVALLSDLLSIPATKLTNALGLGSTLRLLQKVPGFESYSMHQLVREVRREDIPLATREDWAVTIADRLGVWFQKHKRNFGDLPHFESEIEHLRAWQNNIQGSQPNLASRLVWLQAYPPFHRGQFFESHALLQKASNLLKPENDDDLKLRADLLSDLTTINHSIGKIIEAKKCGEEALAIRLKMFGERHSETAMTLNNLGATLEGLGDLQNSPQYRQQALECRQKALSIWLELNGENHIDTALALDGVSQSYRSLGKNEESLQFAERALAVREKVLGLLHPDTATSFSNVGRIHTILRNFPHALQCEEKALEITERLFGLRSPIKCAVLNNIGAIHFDLRNFRKALEIEQLCLTMRLELFGNHHPAVAISIGNVAACYFELGRPHQGFQTLDEHLKVIPHDSPSYEVLKAKSRVHPRSSCLE
jgi:tetratricopeptide (TPR) repeat protein